MKIKTIFTIGYWFVLSILITVAAAVILSSFNTPLKFRLFSVHSGSMRPAIPLGSLVIIQPQENYVKTDIITFRGEGDPKQTVTHRIVEVHEDKDIGKISYQTKGDANEDPDSELILAQRVVGKVVFTIPYLGYPIAFAQTQTGFIALIIIPGTLIIYTELINIKNEVLRLFKERRDKRKT